MDNRSTKTAAAVNMGGEMLQADEFENVQINVARSFSKMAQPKEVTSKICVTMGKVGTGKTSTKNCMAGDPLNGASGWRDGTTEIECKKYHLVNEDDGLQLTLYDTKGFVGNLKKDYTILCEMLQEIGEDVSRIDCVFLCLSSQRFTEADKAILDMITEYTTPEFQSLIRVVITQAPKKVLTADFLEDVTTRLSFLGASPEEILAKKIVFVNLIHPQLLTEEEDEDNGMVGVDDNAAVTAIHAAIEEKWVASQRALFAMIRSCNPTAAVGGRRRGGGLKIKGIFRHIHWMNLVKIYQKEIIFVAVLLLVLAFLHLFIIYYDLSMDHLVKVNACISKVKEMERMAQIERQQRQQEQRQQQMMMQQQQGCGWINGMKMFWRLLSLPPQAAGPGVGMKLNETIMNN